MADYKQAEWVNAEGPLQGHKTFLRKNVSLLKTAKEEFPYVVIVYLLYQHRDSDGMPTCRSELENLDATEEAIATRMERTFDALFGLVVTSDGTRDLFFFLPAESDGNNVEDAIQDAEPSVDYDFSVRHDSLWQPYVNLLPSPDA